MPAKYHKYADEPIVLVTLPTNYNLQKELPQVLPFYLSQLDSFDGQVYWLVDAREASLNVEEIMVGANLVARGQHPLYHHANIREVIYITSSEIMKLAADGLRHQAFGRVKIKVYDDLDEALKYVRESL